MEYLASFSANVRKLMGQGQAGVEFFIDDAFVEFDANLQEAKLVSDIRVLAPSV